MDQLIKKNNVNGYTNVYPFTYIENISDEDGNKLKDLLISYNHLFIDYQGSVEETRKFISSEYRRKGLYITYIKDGNITTEFYKGPEEDISNDILFVEDINWEKIPNIDFVINSAYKIPNGSILPEHLSSSLQELLSENHTIINYPDDEDLTQCCKILKFKDRPYNSGSASGKGYKILRKNWVEGVNLLTQDMISDPNTIYEVRYDFTTNNQTLTVPEGSVIRYNGGSITGTVNYSRPTGMWVGYQHFDTTLNKPIWWTGDKWVDANGSTV